MSGDSCEVVGDIRGLMCGDEEVLKKYGIEKVEGSTNERTGNT